MPEKEDFNNNLIYLLNKVVLNINVERFRVSPEDEAVVAFRKVTNAGFDVSNFYFRLLAREEIIKFDGNKIVLDKVVLPREIIDKYVLNKITTLYPFSKFTLKDLVRDEDNVRGLSNYSASRSLHRLVCSGDLEVVIRSRRSSYALSSAGKNQ